VCLCALLGLVLACAGAPAAMSAALEGGNSFEELNQAQQRAPTQTTATTAPPESGSSSTSNTVIVLALVAAVVLLVAIAWVIVRDARKVAPAGDGQLPETGSARHSAARLRKRRARAKAARRQRKRTR
jgi:hypothetical protein